MHRFQRAGCPRAPTCSNRWIAYWLTAKLLESLTPSLCFFPRTVNRLSSNFCHHSHASFQSGHHVGLLYLVPTMNLHPGSPTGAGKRSCPMSPLNSSACQILCLCYPCQHPCHSSCHCSCRCPCWHPLPSPHPFAFCQLQSCVWLPPPQPLSPVADPPRPWHDFLPAFAYEVVQPLPLPPSQFLCFLCSACLSSQPAELSALRSCSTLAFRHLLAFVSPIFQPSPLPTSYQLPHTASFASHLSCGSA
mmetsp:Transcript_72425/g.132263  ORF Transcript_72425/g.132263 Transcript_72425/m.132263 type:complete len:247 (-) Transcript_72425:266-1006(-)